MGHDNVRLAYARWGHLPDPSFRVLAFMGLRSLDDAEPPIFFEGREALAFALGRMTPDDPAPSDSSKRAEEYRKARDADFRAVKRALTPLFKVGVVAVFTRPSRVHRAEYSLHLLAPNGGRFAAPTGDVSWSNGGREMSEPGTFGDPRRGGIKGGDLEETNSNNSNTNTTSPSSLNSPAAGNKIDKESEYSSAQRFLAEFPNLGADYMNLDEVLAIEGYHERVVAAAAIARTAKGLAS